MSIKKKINIGDIEPGMVIRDDTFMGQMFITSVEKEDVFVIISGMSFGNPEQGCTSLAQIYIFREHSFTARRRVKRLI